MVLPGGLPVLPLLPAVAVPSVPHLLAGVEEHGARLWPRFQFVEIGLLGTDKPYLNFLREPVMVTVKGDQHRCNFLQ